MKLINTFTLKMIAIVTMLIDHIGHVFFPELTALRMIGRISFPIFAYLLAEGFFYTKDVKKYMMRLGAFALLSEMPYDLAIMGQDFDFSYQNVFFTLFFSILMLWLISKTYNIVAKYVVVAIIILICMLLQTDYCTIGPLLVFLFYEYRNQARAKLILTSLVMVLFTGGIQLAALFALPFIMLHNRVQGPKIKAFFYNFYPVHLMILYLIQQFI